mmetsp:Transcript_4462/g.8073  ORF Transcript_4462/g.8073 Transcript_4462/m.8073 type:complete len:116 (+) Transcript_4462:120-467(+)
MHKRQIRQEAKEQQTWWPVVAILMNVNAFWSHQSTEESDAFLKFFLLNSISCVVAQIAGKQDQARGAMPPELCKPNQTTNQRSALRDSPIRSLILTSVTQEQMQAADSNIQKSKL